MWDATIKNEYYLYKARMRYGIEKIMGYRIEVANPKNPVKPFHALFTACTNDFMIPIILIPGIECPFRGLELSHKNGGRT